MARADTEILEIVGRLHEGVIDPAMWKQGIDGVCGLLAAPLMLVGDVAKGGHGVAFAFGHQTNPKAVSLLEGPLADPAHNPWLTVAERHPLRRPAMVADAGGREQLEASRVWQDFYVPFGIGDSAGAVLERQPEYSNVMIMGRLTRQPGFSPADMRMFGTVLPHLARAWRVRRALAEMEEMVGTLRFVLDRIERGVIVAGPGGEVRFANRAADALLSRGGSLDASRGRLRAARPHHTDALLALIDRAAATGVGAHSVAVDAVAIPSANGDPPLAVVAEPLAPAHSEVLGHHSVPGAILFIGDSEACTRPPIERLRVVYGFTPAEARLTAMIVEGHGIASAAQALGVSANTVKFHLKTVFEKVDVTRQTQLVRRVLSDVGGLAEPEKMLPAKPSSSDLAQKTAPATALPSAVTPDLIRGPPS
jgi:DNA-binding CsgD family transcriptional regulator/PAS domain-containing protein